MKIPTAHLEPDWPAIAHASSNAIAAAAMAAELVKAQDAMAAELVKTQAIDWSACSTASSSQISSAGITRETLIDAMKTIRGFKEEERKSAQMLKGAELDAALDSMYRKQNPDPYADIMDGLGHLGQVDVKNQCFRFHRQQDYPDLVRARIDVRSLRALKGRRFDFSLCEEIYSLLNACGIYIESRLTHWESFEGTYELTFEKPPISKANVVVSIDLSLFKDIFKAIACWFASSGIDNFVLSSFFIAKAKTHKDLSKVNLAEACNRALKERDSSGQNERILLAVNTELRQKIAAYEAEITKLKATSLEKISAARLTGFKPKRKVTRLPTK